MLVNELHLVHRELTEAKPGGSRLHVPMCLHLSQHLGFGMPLESVFVSEPLSSH